MHVIRVVLGHPQRSFVEALGMSLAMESRLDVIAAVAQPEETLRIVSSRPVDIAVLGFEGGNGFLDLAPALLAARPDLKLVAISAGDDDAAALERAVRQGFRGWVPKEVGIPVLIDALEAACRGETWIPPLLLTRLLHHLLHAEEEHRAAALPFASLTAREQQVLQAMARGANRQEIAVEMSISANTVRTHMQSILTKLGVHTSLAAVTLARRAGVT